MCNGYIRRAQAGAIILISTFSPVTQMPCHVVYLVRMLVLTECHHHELGLTAMTVAITLCSPLDPLDPGCLGILLRLPAHSES